MNLQGDPGGDEVVGQAQVVGLLLRQDQRQSFVLAHENDKDRARRDGLGNYKAWVGRTRTARVCSARPAS